MFSTNPPHADHYSFLAIACDRKKQRIVDAEIAGPTTFNVDDHAFDPPPAVAGTVHVGVYLNAGGGAPPDEPAASCSPAGAHATLASQCCSQQLEIPTVADPSNRCHS
ncbi:MAG TPA: hypothetical protein VGM90_20620 [Kofleriaceae bacterium]|jgi:hypothetical protein